MSRREAHDLHRRFVNPGFVELLEAFDFGREFVHASGATLRDDEGRDYVDALSGYGVHNVGHNHPRIVSAVQRALARSFPSMLNVDAPLSQGELARKLAAATHPELCRAGFANSGAEAVDIAVRMARAATGRKALLACHGSYHGLSVGALSLMDDPAHRAPFEPLLADVSWVRFGDLEAIERACKEARPAAFFVEPVQAEGGIRIPDAFYLSGAARICKDNGVLLVIDEIQTGVGRTGRVFATPFDLLVPDALLAGKALSGGMVPVSVMLAKAGVWEKAFGGMKKCRLHASTFAGGDLAMAVASEVLDVVREEGLCERASSSGALLLDRLEGLRERHKIIREVRGIGLLVGVEFEPPGMLMKVVPKWVRDGLFSQVVCSMLLKKHGVLAQPCSLAPQVLRLEPPLVISDEEIDKVVDALDQTLKECPSHASALQSAVLKSALGKEL
ncbi:MAG: aspartate aminotransferase family protein [Deltaproteobacteria bacterium]|nr:aspartate aminotransferase family protein [Deltaproteobacteria bacterium]